MIKFKNSNSGFFQESFVLNMTKEKQNGFYVELGVEDAYKNSNTFLLESQYNWTGLPLEINESHVERYNKTDRKNKCVHGDATRFNYIKYFEENNFPKQIDYLQIDIDAHERGIPLLALVELPLSTYRFSVITYEHDVINNYKNKDTRDAQREILNALGYILVLPSNVEDWWVDPNVITRDIFMPTFVIDLKPNISGTA